MEWLLWAEFITLFFLKRFHLIQTIAVKLTLVMVCYFKDFCNCPKHVAAWYLCSLWTLHLYKSCVFLFLGSLVVVGKVLWNRVCPSFSLSIYLRFSWNFTIGFFLNLGMVPETHMKLCMAELNFPEIGKMGPKMSQNRAFWIYWKILSLIFTEFVQ